MAPKFGIHTFFAFLLTAFVSAVSAQAAAIGAMPLRQSAADEVVSISAGELFTVVLKKDGTLWAWGDNDSGQLGDGTKTKRARPVRIGSDSNWASASAGADHTVAIKTDGTLWAWGSNDYGQIGDGTPTKRYAPVQIGTDRDWKSVSCGSSSTFAIKTDGTLWAWGSNVGTMLGDAADKHRFSPEQIGTDRNWLSLSAKGDYAIKTDGTLWALRSNLVQIGKDKNWHSVSSGGHTLAIKKDGTLWAWGSNGYGRLGIGSSVKERPTPTQVGTDKNWAFASAGYWHSLAIKKDGTLWAWGNNGNGQIGDGTSLSTNNKNAPVRIGTASNWKTVSGGGGHPGSHSVALTADGNVWAWGHGNFGQIGDGIRDERHSPVQVLPLPKREEAPFVAVESVSARYRYSLAIRADGSLWAWGQDFFGALGDGTSETRHVPVRIGTAKNWASVTTAVNAGYSFGVRTDGTLWAWGSNGGGQLGDGTRDNRFTPVPVGTGRNWKSASAGSLHTLAIKTDGTLWAWGSNSDGSFGVAEPEYSFTPIQIGNDTNWLSVSACAGFSIGLKTDGTLWGWGHFQVLNSRRRWVTVWKRNTPVQIGAAANWASISANLCTVFAVRADGTLWGFGDNVFGQLGVGSPEDNKMSPVQVGTARNWATVAAGPFHTVAIKTDGTLWAWGNNELGQLGDGTTARKRSPIQVGTDKDWKTASVGDNFTVAVKTDGTLWTWGENHYGTLGDNTDINRHRPWRIVPPTEEEQPPAPLPATQQPVAQPAKPPPAANHNVYVAGRYDGKSVYDTRACNWKNGARTNLSDTSSEAVGIAAVNNDVYVVGYYSDNNKGDRACYWKNGELTTLSSVHSRGHAITVVNNDVYVAGWYSAGNGDWLACYWKNGELTPVSKIESSASAIAVVNNDVYVAGYYKGDDKIFYACYWKNGQRTILSKEESEATAISVVRNVVYVAGYRKPGVTPFACYWKNGQRIGLGSVGSKASGMAVVNGDVYVAGYYAEGHMEKACYWKNNAQQRTSLYSPGYSAASGISLADDVVYVAGYCDDFSRNRWAACYWKNEERTILFAHTGNSSASGIAVAPL